MWVKMNARVKRVEMGVWGMRNKRAAAQQSGALAALPENQGLIPSIHTMVPNSSTRGSGTSNRHTYGEYTFM